METLLFNKNIPNNNNFVQSEKKVDGPHWIF